MRFGVVRGSLLSVGLALLLVACGGGSAPTSTPASSSTATATRLAATNAAGTTTSGAATIAPSAASISATSASGSATSRPAGTTAAASAPSGTVTTAGVTPSFTVGGAVQGQITLMPADLQALPPVTVSAETRTRQGSQGTHQYTGPLLKDVLDKAKLKLDPNRKNDQLNRVVTAVGSDGYRATVAYGEIDPDFGNQQVMVAYAMDGKPLGADGVAELIVPGDKLAGRWVKNIVSVTVGDPAS